MKKEFTVIALGGSIVVPELYDGGGINVSFLRELRGFLLQEIENGRRFIIVVGGGKTTRLYQKAASQIVEMADEDLDWIGIHATRLNAHLLRTVFVKDAYPVVIDHDPSLREVASLKRKKKNLFMASGWRPGWSTDYVAVRLAKKFGARDVIDASNIPFVYDGDPRTNGNAKPIREISWKEYRKLIPSAWSPGMASPVDPVAAGLAEKAGLLVKVLQGTDLKNLKRAVEGMPFEGTVIK